jgi:hypothetical protein
MIKKILLSIFIFFSFGLGINILNPSQSECINVYVDYGNNFEIENKCINANGKINSLDLLADSGYKIEGTLKYGNAVVCRVNNFPDKSIERCEDMPPQDAYWAVIVKKNQVLPFPRNDWGWAQKGINETFVEPGDHLGLVFSTKGEVRWP